ncbi:ATP-binding cassette domain-containing protein [Thermosipho atlanticus]|uniref:Energy-coupling factor transport system ATP-binding protein n=1 Tax=Thermosipho atlanticus DSM 15807 TaxID=1123380 RepID=A0A1M5SS45_9BACT|nr:ATP-binding cassette domain-containing protein [Thermosipho atlanticus]SHH41118.1 energy-coupling factor transport system ATP-binding protein [Thermosipho atlanticus DSM 15807]
MTISLVNVSYVYNKNTPIEKKVLKRVNLEINLNEVIYIVGKTGSGKTTLLYLIDFLIKPTSGIIYVDGKSPYDNPDKYRKNIGFAFQFPERQFFSETVKDEITFSLKNLNIDNVDKRLEYVQRILDIDDEMLTKNPFKLSGGEQRRVAIASAIVHDPEILILDEPTVSLDYINEARIITFLKEWSNIKNKTLVIVTHDIEKFKEIPGKVYYLKKGKLIRSDSIGI